MQTGDIILVDFPFTNLTESKIRPAVVVNIAKDKFHDIIICLISSVIPGTLHNQEILLSPNLVNNLHLPSIIKVYRVATVKQSLIISAIGRLNESELKNFKIIFKSLVD